MQIKFKKKEKEEMDKIKNKDNQRTAQSPFRRRR